MTHNYTQTLNEKHLALPDATWHNSNLHKWRGYHRKSILPSGFSWANSIAPRWALQVHRPPCFKVQMLFPPKVTAKSCKRWSTCKLKGRYKCKRHHETGAQGVPVLYLSRNYSRMLFVGKFTVQQGKRLLAVSSKWHFFYFIYLFLWWFRCIGEPTSNHFIGQKPGVWLHSPNIACLINSFIR